jgi:hypothetical protein
MGKPCTALVTLDHVNGIIRRSNYERFAEEACGIGVAQFADRGQASHALVARKIVRFRESFPVAAHHVVRAGFGSVPGFFAPGGNEHRAQLHDEEVVRIAARTPIITSVQRRSSSSRS